MINNISIRNLKDGIIKGENVFRIDRSSSLGNPFTIPPYSRKEAIDGYKTILIPLLSQDSRERVYFEKLLDAARIGDITLMCWCWPLPCHGDVIRQLLIERLQEERRKQLL
jgi:hypothetical protein